MSAFAASDDPEGHDYSYAEPDPATTTPPMPQDQPDPESSHSHSRSRSRSNNPLLGNDNPLVSELEQEVLDEYSRLLRNVNQVSADKTRSRVSHIHSRPSKALLYACRLNTIGELANTDPVI